jgi:hypothetical protein
MRRHVLETLPVRHAEHRRALAVRWVGAKKCAGADAPLAPHARRFQGSVLSDGEHTTRKPRLSFRLFGLFLLRLAERAPS